MRWKIRALFFAWIFLFLTGCSYDPKSQETELVADENRLVIYTSHKEEVYAPIIQEFEERTGICVTVVSGGTKELLERIKQEDQFSCDVMFGGGAENLVAYSDYFIPYQVSDKDKLIQYDENSEHCWTPFSNLPIVIIYNDKLVYEKTAPQGFKDLLSSRWQGKIAFANPQNSGSSYTILATLLTLYKDNQVLLDFARSLDYDQFQTSQDVIDAVVKGTKLIGITLEETAQKKMKAGYDVVMIYPEDGTSIVPDGTAIIKGALHKKNAEAFIEFTVSEDVQKYITTYCSRRPVRIDMMDQVPMISCDVIDYDIIWASKNQERILTEWVKAMNKEGRMN